MELLGYEISIRRKAAVSPIGATGGWRSFVAEPFSGAWQRNIVKTKESVLTHSAVYACVTLIASDIGKLRLKLVERDEQGIWTEADSAAFSPVLRKPNRYQTRQKFIEQWLVSKLLYGNTYVLKERDARGVVRAMYVLDPTRVRAYVAPDGDVIYQLNSDNLTGIIQNGIQVPASEIIHDVMVPLYHPLCGVSPISACALPAAHGLNIQEHSAQFFANASKPSGMLTAPGVINQETADRLKKQFEERFSGDNVGRLAVAGDGLKFESLAINATDSQLIEQLKWTAEQVCTCFHVPAYMIGVGSPPTYNNIEALNAQYYAQCLQALIEAIEALLDEGLGLSTKPETSSLGTEFDLDDLLRMDTPTRVKAVSDQINAALLSPNEGRAAFNRKPVKGGEQPLLQQQMWQLGQLAERPPPDDVPDPPTSEGPDDEPDIARIAALEVREPKSGPAGSAGVPGRGITDAIQDADGNLVLTFSDGTTKNVGRIRGEDQEPRFLNLAEFEANVRAIATEAAKDVAGQPRAGGHDSAAGLIAALESDIKEFKDQFAESESKAEAAFTAIEARHAEISGRLAATKNADDAIRDATPAIVADAIEGIRKDFPAIRKQYFPPPTFLIDQDGNLVQLSDGEAKILGRVRGKDGEAGRDAEPAPKWVKAEVDQHGELLIEMSDGQKFHCGHVRGASGADGLGFDDFSEVIEDDGRVMVHSYKRGDQAKEFRHTTGWLIDRGTYREGSTYERGDMVTWGGSGWVCQKETQTKPGDGSADWRLFVKRGRDGRDGKDGEKGERGVPGKDGRSAY